MNMNRVLSLIMVAVIYSGTVGAQITWNAAHVDYVRRNIKSNFYSLAYERLKADADAMTDKEPLSVMMKDKTPASGDKHDYMSMARYFWPDPEKADGLPYINRDGVSNPELECYDRNRLGEAAERITTLSLAWYLSGDDIYARKAVEQIRMWFINRDTRMNPNLEYAQMVPGLNGGKGRSYGVLDTYSFVEMLNGVVLLEQSDVFTKKDIRALKQWFGQLTRWMLTSSQGREEGEAQNNHSVAYDAQVIAFAIYSGDTKTADRIADEFAARRIFRQIEADGSQPHELTRTLSFGYSEYNLAHIIDVLMMRSGRIAADAQQRVVKALEFLARYAGRPVSDWPYEQISQWEVKQQELCKDLYRMAAYTDNKDNNFFNIFINNRVLDFSDRFWLTAYKATPEDEAMAYAQRQMQVLMNLTAKARNEKENAARRLVTPRTVDGEGKLVMVGAYDWCSGFVAGTLWQLYEYTRNDKWRRMAISNTWPIEEAQWHGGTHDLGFMIGDSFGKAYELTGERSYKDVMLQASRTLITRYNDKVGCIRSWDHNADKWRYPVIIDNMMNLEMLFKATELTGDTVFRHIAMRHADTTLKNHFRKDASSYHVVDYDPETGEVRTKCTAQGYSDESYWSRGQAWGLYGYTMCYRFTHDMAYLEHARHIAQLIMSQDVADDMIPYWDMKDPDIPNTSRDASAAAITASAMFELSDYVEADESAVLRGYASRLVDSLSAGYQYNVGGGCGFLLQHSTGHHPANSEIDVPLNYADYYYVEALIRKIRHK